MPRTHTASNPPFSLTLLSGPVHLTFPPPSSPNRTTLTIPPNSKLTTTLHWHETHTETSSSSTASLRPLIRHHKIDKFVRHQYMRADVDRQDFDQADNEGDVVIREWTGLKEMMFRNRLSALFVDAEGGGSDQV
ncbi:MAG: hypothetical protein M1830_009310 [Pleopsidium flavum]|nr:MAG: hypothetical protein M1830_009310 [Pleopsidium flavum]